jgi:hypothetical protein
MQRATTQPPTQHSSKRTAHQPTSVQGQITAAQVWQQLSATQQQVLQRTLIGVCRSFVTQVANEEVHDDRS